MDLTLELDHFIASKDLSSNSQLAYRYDLLQFLERIDGKLTAGQLALYGASLLELKPSVQRRKISTVNQYLYYLYEQELVERLYKLKPKKQVKTQEKTVERADLSPLFQESSQVDGQLIALLIAQIGLTPSELSTLKWEDVHLSMRVMTIQRGGVKRVLSIPDSLLPYVTE
ncbi:site-specific tyrosine recombinase XerD, partial [Streptococcus sp. DD13]|uniref:site-specific tyrosine recombinase XerD n=1 Tax=Streptococcus sp. DD13 TaxID=1777881 RepID=UPI0009EDFD5F